MVVGSLRPLYYNWISTISSKGHLLLNHWQDFTQKQVRMMHQEIPQSSADCRPTHDIVKKGHRTLDCHKTSERPLITAITHCRPTHDIVRKSHNTLDCHKTSGRQLNAAITHCKPTQYIVRNSHRTMDCLKTSGRQLNTEITHCRQTHDIVRKSLRKLTVTRHQGDSQIPQLHTADHPTTL